MQVNGWELFAHPLLLDQLDKLVTKVEKERVKKPKGHQSSANFKVLAALRQLIFVTVPADPTRQEYRQGGTLGPDRKHWFRVKFGGQRFRLFFRYDSKAKIIIYAWVNDSDTLRTYGAKNDAYAVSSSVARLPWLCKRMMRSFADGYASTVADVWLALSAQARAHDETAATHHFSRRVDGLQPHGFLRPHARSPRRRITVA